jgi:predicted cupin superfamily sugar epimerase
MTGAQAGGIMGCGLGRRMPVNFGTHLSAEEIKDLLGLEPHPTCGFVAETYRSPLKIPSEALPKAYEGDRPYGSALYFLVSPEAQIVMHRIRSDQLYHHYMGDPLEVLMLYPNGTGAVASVGSDLTGGERPQLFVPGDTFHTSRRLRTFKSASKGIVQRQLLFGFTDLYPAPADQQFPTSSLKIFNLS